MADQTTGRPIDDRFAPRRSFARWKEKPSPARDYLEFLVHYEAELRQTDGPVVIVRRKTGAELPLEQKGRLMIVRILLDEFGTIDGANKAIENYATSHS